MPIAYDELIIPAHIICSAVAIHETLDGLVPLEGRVCRDAIAQREYAYGALYLDGDFTRSRHA